MEIRQGEEAVVIGEDLAPFPHFPKRLLHEKSQATQQAYFGNPLVLKNLFS